MFKFIGLDKFDFSLNADSFLDNVQNFFTKGFSDDSDLISEKSFQTQSNGGYSRNNYPNSTGTHRRRLPLQPDKNSSTTSNYQVPQVFDASQERTLRHKTADASFISSNYSSTSPPPNFSRRDSAQSSLYSETGNRSNSKLSVSNQNHHLTDANRKLPNEDNGDSTTEMLSYNSRPLMSNKKTSGAYNIIETKEKNSDKNLNSNLTDSLNDNNEAPSNFSIFSKNSSGFRRPFFFKHTGSTPRDRWLRAYEFVKHQLPSVSKLLDL